MASTSAATGGPPRRHCKLASSFAVRLLIMVLATGVFLLYTNVRRKLGLEKRGFKTFAADTLKVGAQMVLGGVLLALMGGYLGHIGLDALSWYGAEYPFEVVMSTYLTKVMKDLTSKALVWLHSRTKSPALQPFLHFGRYGESPGVFNPRWFYLQLFQAVFLINLPARLISLATIFVSLRVLPLAYSPVLLLGQFWFTSRLTCIERTTAILYILPLVGDAAQFVIIDGVQRARRGSMTML